MLLRPRNAALKALLSLCGCKIKHFTKYKKKYLPISDYSLNFARSGVCMVHTGCVRL